MVKLINSCNHLGTNAFNWKQCSLTLTICSERYDRVCFKRCLCAEIHFVARFKQNAQDRKANNRTGLMVYEMKREEKTNLGM